MCLLVWSIPLLLIICMGSNITVCIHYNTTCYTMPATISVIPTWVCLLVRAVMAGSSLLFSDSFNENLRLTVLKTGHHR